MPWADFATAAPGFAGQGRALIERFGFVIVGTIRADGTPQISPVEVHLVGRRVVFLLFPPQARDPHGGQSEYTLLYNVEP